ncbi:hypothetical protein SporoP37_01970 [Sporosarcina sp. P37]|nr:hypothetical protein SporoP37_01970 [Sporosarcina sp. P37]
MKKRGKIKKGLVSQLKENGTTAQHHMDMVDNYLTMWDMAQALEVDFHNNGVKVMTSTGSKINPSIPEYTKTNNQMLRLLSEMGLKPVRQEPEVDPDEDY